MILPAVRSAVRTAISPQIECMAVDTDDPALNGHPSKAAYHIDLAGRKVLRWSQLRRWRANAGYVIAQYNWVGGSKELVQYFGDGCFICGACRAQSAQLPQIATQMVAHFDLGPVVDGSKAGLRVRQTQEVGEKHFGFIWNR